MATRRSHDPGSGPARDAADRIITRHDPTLAVMDDSLPGVVAHVARHGDPADRAAAAEHYPPGRLADDVVDALLVLDHLDALYARQLARWRLGVLRAAERAGMGPTQLAPLLHQRHRQGVAEQVDRLAAQLDPRVGTADAAALRRIRATAAAAGAAAAATVEVATGADTVIDAAAALVAARELVPTSYRDLVDDVADRLPGGPYASPAGLVAALRLACADLADLPRLDTRLRAVVDHGAQTVARNRM